MTKDRDDDETPKTGKRHTAKGRLRRMAKIGGVLTGAGTRLAAEKLAGFLLSDDKRERLRRKIKQENARSLTRAMGDLKGVAMKLGQSLSMAPSAISEEFAHAFIELHSDAPPMDYATLAAQVERAYDLPLDQLFRYFDPEPLGAASIGQVHRAELFDGRKVAVKVQYPGVMDSVDSDLKNLSTILRLVHGFTDSEVRRQYLAEVRRMMLREGDYIVEAETMREFHERMTDWPGVRIPRPFDDLVRPQAFVMELCEGVKIDRKLASLPIGPERNRLALQWCRLLFDMFFNLQLLHTDPHPGNVLCDEGGDLVLLDFGSARRFDEEFTDSFLLLVYFQMQEEWDKLKVPYRRLGFRFPESSLGGEALRRLHEIVLEPFVKDIEFDFASWRLRSRLSPVYKRYPSLFQLVPPSNILFTLRVFASLRGIFQQFRIRANLYREMLERIEKRDIPQKAERWLKENDD